MDYSTISKVTAFLLFTFAVLICLFGRLSQLVDVSIKLGEPKELPSRRIMENRVSSPLTLYRRNSTKCTPKSVLDNLTYHRELERLLIPPTYIRNWKPPNDIAKKSRRQAIKLLEPWKNGFGSNRSIYNDYSCLEAHDEPIVIQYINRILYFNSHPYFRPPGSFREGDFLYHRRLHAIHAIYEILLDPNLSIVDFEAVICIGDGGPSFKTTIAFGLVASKYHSNFLPLSEMEHDFKSYSWWNRTFHDIKKWRSKYPWESRKNVAVFRGGSRTCYPPNGDEAAKKSEQVEYMLQNKQLHCGRYNLFLVANRCLPHLFDVQLDQNNIPQKEQEQFKYVIYAEGHYGWANRLKTLLGMQSAIILQLNEGYYEWYSAGLVPWVHYIPVDHLFLSLPDVVLWATKHDDMVKAISRNADRYFECYLSVESIKLRIKILLQEYSKLFNYKLHPLPSSIVWSEYLRAKYILYGRENIRVKEWD